jgi:hypothetical protein
MITHLNVPRDGIRISVDFFRERVDMVNRFITFRLQNQHRFKTEPKKFAPYEADWPTAAAARVMALFCILLMIHMKGILFILIESFTLTRYMTFAIFN